jgi:hypothetical protein
MFSSNQKLLISGDNEKYLKIVLDCIVALGELKLNAYSIDDINGLMFYCCLDDNLPNIFYIPKEEIGNNEYTYNIIRLYLSSKKYLNLLHKIKNPADKLDGSSWKGWLIGLCKDIENLEERFDWRKTFYVKPYWSFYHK